MGKKSRRNNSQDLVAQQVMQDKMVRNLERENRYLEALLKNYETRDQLKLWIPKPEEVGNQAETVTPTGTVTGDITTRASDPIQPMAGSMAASAV